MMTEKQLQRMVELKTKREEIAIDKTIRELHYNGPEEMLYETLRHTLEKGIKRCPELIPEILSQLSKETYEALIQFESDAVNKEAT